jgi:hypothetical protein
MDEDSFRLIFEDGTMIRKKYEARIEVVTVFGPGPNEFTRYPQDIDPIDISAEEKQRLVGLMLQGGLPPHTGAQIDQSEEKK